MGRYFLSINQIHHRILAPKSSNMFSEFDHQQIAKRGSTTDQIQEQIENFKNGFPALKLEGPAIDGNGILVLSNNDINKHIEFFDLKTADNSIVKFVPASGAASRMFKSLFAFVESYNGSEEDYDKFSSGETHKEVYNFFSNIHDFAFYNDLKQSFDQKGERLEEAHLKRKYVEILKELLEESGLNYGNLPKGLLKFHSYPDFCRTPAEEHMVEGAHYAKDQNGKVRLHFTVSPEHKKIFEKHIEEVRSGYEQEFGVIFEVNYSVQKTSTDTIAVDLKNEPFRNDDNSLLFRPAGHGALIANLDEIDADVIFVKNIDNVVPDHLKDTTHAYKKVIGGILLETQEQVFQFLNKLDSSWNEELENEIIGFGRNCLNFIVPKDYSSQSDSIRREYLHNMLNRPIRTSGMVSNIGDPGGGPFWASNNDGSVSLQIVETAQVDLNDSSQKSIFDQSTHFNPVDLACAVKNYKGDKFDLTKYVDPKTGFTTLKSKDGKDLKAQELPGLWNGSMSDWISIFIEVPVITFNPVKQVNDLIKKTHQPG